MSADVTVMLFLGIGWGIALGLLYFVVSFLQQLINEFSRRS